MFLAKYKAVLLIELNIILYFVFAYFLERTNFTLLTSLWFGLFACFYFLLKDEKIPIQTYIGLAVLFRLIFLFTKPNLSQDFYRFIWDGRMILQGFNPYLSLPESLIQQHNYPIAQAIQLYEGMGEMNGSHYTNYPPINQLCFLIAAIFASKSIFGAAVVLRIIIILADIGILYFGTKLLEKLHLPIKKIFWFVLNPFIIIELTGNLHFESVMLFFFVWALYQLHQKKWIFAAILIACSVSVKLIPLLFLPLFLQYFISRKELKKLNIIFLKKGLHYILFVVIVLLTTLVLFLPFYSSTLIENYANSVGLWFRNFEFNASFYYIFREIGYWFRGYNEIAIIGKILPIITVLFLAILTLFRNNSTTKKMTTAFLFGICFYYFFSTTVHPWYLATPLLLCVFTKYRFPIIWSLVIILSYQAYANSPWKENLWFVFIEYIVVFSFLLYELKEKKTSTLV